MIEMTAADAVALWVLANAPPKELARRSGSYLAEATGVSASAASRRIERLIDASLLRRRGRTVELTVPEEIVWHRHPEGVACTGVHRGPLLDHPEICVEWTMPTNLEKFGKRLQAYEKKRGRPTSKQTYQRLAEILAKAYERKRQAVEGFYELTPGDRAKAVEAVKALRTRLVRQGLYLDYVDHAFETFGRIRNLPYPPMTYLKSSFAVDAFVTDLGPRGLDMAGVERVLREHGLAHVEQSTAAAIAQRCMEGVLSAFDTESDTAKAVRVLIDNVQDVGMVQLKG